MPGVNLDFLPASQAPEALGSPDSACAESGLEDVIGDLLAQEEAKDEQEHESSEEKLELTLRCAVGEIHSDLQAFGKRMDARLEASAAQVVPLSEAIVMLQEENLRLRAQQERLVRRVEALCQVLGLPDPLLHVLPGKESSPLNPLCETKTPSSDSPTSGNDPLACAPQDTALDALHDSSSCSPEDSLPRLSQDTPADSPLDTPSGVSQEMISCPQDSTLQRSEPSPVPHPPTFATLRSLSAPALMANISCDDSEVLHSVNGPDQNLLYLR